MSKNYIVFDSMMVPPQKNIFLLLYCIIFDNKFLLILRNSKLLSINFLCVTLSHMSIHTGAICLLFQFPDVSVVLCDGSVGGEESGLGDVHQHHLLPLLMILVIGECLILYLDVIF